MSVCLFHCFSLPDSPFLCYLMVTSYFLILGTKSHYHVKKIHRQCDPFFPLNSPSRGFNSISGCLGWKGFNIMTFSENVKTLVARAS